MGIRGESSLYTRAGLGDTLSEIKDGVQGTIKFIDNLSSLFASVAGFVGLVPIMVFLCVMLISGAYSLFGMPKGKTLFFVSLATVDFIWILGARSFEARAFSSWVLIKTNLIILIPFIIVSFLKLMVPIGVMGLYFFRNKIKVRIFNKSPMGGFTSRKYFLEFLGQFQKISMELNQSMVQDLIADRGGDVLPSERTFNNLLNLSRLVEEIKEFPKKTEVE
jgi:hypothetical protein